MMRRVEQICSASRDNYTEIYRYRLLLKKLSQSVQNELATEIMM